jgi:hypothetical protein
MITLQKIQSIDEFSTCINIYADYNDDSFIHVDRKKSLLKLREHSKSGFLYTIKDDGVLVGWLLAERLKHPFSSQSFLQQSFYVTNMRGIKSARAIILAHEELIRLAERFQIEIVLSVGSFYDEQNIFTKVLEKKGWKRRGHTAMWHTSHYKTCNERSQIL